jgi:cis-L-3-hydroxyproline dehydratase
VKISRIELYAGDLPCGRGTYRISGRRTYESFSASIVRILGDNGIEGWGKSTPFAGSIYIAVHGPGHACGDR